MVDMFMFHIIFLEQCLLQMLEKGAGADAMSYKSFLMNHSTYILSFLISQGQMQVMASQS